MDMTHLLRVRRGGYVYLYECVTYRVEGVDTPRNDRIYIGRVGPDGIFKSKKYHVRETFDIESQEVVGGLHELPRVPPCYEGLREFTSSMGPR